MDSNNVHFGTDDKATARWRFFARRTVLVPLLALVFVITGIWVFMGIYEGTKKKQTALEHAITASGSAFQTGDYDKSLESLKAAQSSATTKDQKIELYNNLASAAASSGKMDEAVGYLEKKHELDPASAKSDSLLLGSYYEQISDNAKAIEQYRIYLEYLKSKEASRQTRSEVSSIEARIQDLGGQ